MGTKGCHDFLSEMLLASFLSVSDGVGDRFVVLHTHLFKVYWHQTYLQRTAAGSCSFARKLRMRWIQPYCWHRQETSGTEVDTIRLEAAAARKLCWFASASQGDTPEGCRGAPGGPAAVGPSFTA